MENFDECDTEERDELLMSEPNLRNKNDNFCASREILWNAQAGILNLVTLNVYNEMGNKCNTNLRFLKN